MGRPVFLFIAGSLLVTALPPVSAGAEVAGAPATSSASRAASPAAPAVPAAPAAPSGATAAGATSAAEAAALRRARATGRPVEVAELGTPTRRVSAGPGGTFTLEASAMPVRARRADGSWAPIDTRLRRAGGAIVPAVTAAGLRLSPGGRGPLVELTVPGGSLRLSWPAALPAPELAGDTAVYSEVFPGVDLRVRALAAGFSHVLVVRSRAAAAAPGLRLLRYGVTTRGLRLDQAGPGGALRVLDPAGRPVVSVGQPSMWDSGRGGLSVRAADAAGLVSSSAAAAGDAARQAPMRMRLRGGQLLITPDRRLLTDPDAVFPLYLDPVLTRNRWAYADSLNENNNDGIARVGKNPSGGAIYRSFFEFNTSPIGGKHVLSSVFRITMTHSWSCTSSPVSLYYTGAISTTPRTAWSPGLITHLHERSGHAHKPSTGAGCADDPQPDMPMEFGGGLLTRMQGAANARSATQTLGLSARRADGTGESTDSYWKKFNPGTATLVVEYNSYPGIPDTLTSDGKPCATGAGRPATSAAAPVLRGRYVDADTTQTLSGTFEWLEIPASGTYDATTPRLGTQVISGRPANDFGQVAPANLVDGRSYAWRLQTRDPYDTSQWSPWCELRVDRTAPPPPGPVGSTDYPDDGEFHLGVGRTGTFTLSPPETGAGDVVAYLWALNDNQPSRATPVAVAPGAAATVPITPALSGPNTLFVWTRDAAGNLSDILSPRTYDFFVGFATPPQVRYPMTDAGGTRLTNAGSLGAAADATLSGASVGQGVATFNGTSAAAATAGPVVDNTANFSVAAWVNPVQAATGTLWPTAVAQDGTRGSGFFLRHSLGTSPRWVFTITQSDADGAALVNLQGTTAVRTGGWTHVAGTYEAATRTIRLYVNGVQEGVTTIPGTFRATGALTVGRARWNGQNNHWWNGAIDEVRVWDRLVTPAEVAAMPAEAPPAAFYPLDGTAADASGLGRDATVTGTVTWPAGHNDGGDPGDLAIGFDGSPACARTAGPVLRTDQSFTVAAWVKLDRITGYHTMVSQGGVTRSSFYLQYSAAFDRWAFIAPVADAATTTFVSARSISPPVLNTWVHLAGVYDAAARTMRLYLNGVPQVDQAGAVLWHAAGPLDIGCADAGNHVPGSIDDVAVYAGPATQAQIQQLMSTT